MICTGTRCPFPSSPTNGKVDVSSIAVGSIARYTCNAGFVLQGLGARVCQSSSQWTGADPSCQSKPFVVVFVVVDQREPQHLPSREAK